MSIVYFAIERIGYGSRARYSIKLVRASGTDPVDGKTYRTLEAAQTAADQMGIRIKRTGDLWEILPQPWRDSIGTIR